MAKIDFEIDPNIKEALSAIKEFGRIAEKTLEEVEKAAKESLEPIAEQQRDIRQVGREIRNSLVNGLSSAANSARTFVGRIRDGFRSLRESVFSVQGLIIGLGAAFTGRALVGAFNDVVTAASAQEDAINQLNQSLKAAGTFSAEASADFQDFAAELQANSTIGDEVSLSFLGLATSFGATNEQAKDLVQAAADLSAATGISLESAVRNLGKTFGGLTGELGEVVPALKNLTREQLQSGAAIDLINERFAGFAQSLTKTFSGAVTQAQNTFGDLQEEFGFFITQNPVVIGLINAVSDALRDLARFIASNRQQFLEDFSLAIIDGLDFVLQRLPGFVDTFVRGFEVIRNSVSIVAAGITSFTDTIGFGFTKILGTVARARLFFAEALGDTADIEEFQDQIAELDTIASDFAGNLAENADSITEDAKSIGEALTATDSFVPDNITEGIEDLRAEINGLRGDAGQLSATLSEALDQEVKKDAFVDVIVKAIPDESTLTKNIISAFAQGAQGGQRLIQQGVGAAVDAFAPGFGAVASEIVGILAQGPEATRETVRGFVDGVAEALPAIVESLPILVEELVIAFSERVDEIAISLAQALAENADEIIVAFATAMPRVATALAAQAPFIALAIAEEFIRSLPDIILGVREGFKQAALELRDSLRRSFEDIGRVLSDGFQNAIREFTKGVGTAVESFGQQLLAQLSSLPEILFEGVLSAGEGLITVFSDAGKAFIDAVLDGAGGVLEGIGGGGGGVGGFVNSVRSAVGFQEGGIIPQGFNNDTFPALLSSGEAVIPRDTTERLARFLERNDRNTEQAAATQVPAGAQQLTVNLVVGEEQLSQVKLDLSRQGFRVA